MSSPWPRPRDLDEVALDGIETPRSDRKTRRKARACKGPGRVVEDDVETIGGTLGSVDSFELRRRISSNRMQEANKRDAVEGRRKTPERKPGTRKSRDEERKRKSKLVATEFNGDAKRSKPDKEEEQEQEEQEDIGASKVEISRVLETSKVGTTPRSTKCYGKKRTSNRLLMASTPVMLNSDGFVGKLGSGRSNRKSSNRWHTSSSSSSGGGGGGGGGGSTSSSRRHNSKQEEHEGPQHNDAPLTLPLVGFLGCDKKSWHYFAPRSAPSKNGPTIAFEKDNVKIVLTHDTLPSSGKQDTTKSSVPKDVVSGRQVFTIKVGKRECKAMAFKFKQHSNIYYKVPRSSSDAMPIDDEVVLVVPSQDFRRHQEAIERWGKAWPTAHRTQNAAKTRARCDVVFGMMKLELDNPNDSGLAHSGSFKRADVDLQLDKGIDRGGRRGSLPNGVDALQQRSTLLGIWQESPRRTTRRSAKARRRHNVSAGEENDVMFRYPLESTNRNISAITVRKSELLRTEDGVYLNDSLIDLGIKIALCEDLPASAQSADAPSKEDQRLVYAFSSLFFKRLLDASRENKGSGRAREQKVYASVERWARRVELFRQKLLIIPVNDAQHWSLLILCNGDQLVHKMLEFAIQAEAKKCTDLQLKVKRLRRKLCKISDGGGDTAADDTAARKSSSKQEEAKVDAAESAKAEKTESAEAGQTEPGNAEAKAAGLETLEIDESAATSDVDNAAPRRGERKPETAKRYMAADSGDSDRGPEVEAKAHHGTAKVQLKIVCDDNDDDDDDDDDDGGDGDGEEDEPAGDADQAARVAADAATTPEAVEPATSGPRGSPPEFPIRRFAASKAESPETPPPRTVAERGASPVTSGATTTTLPTTPERGKNSKSSKMIRVDVDDDEQKETLEGKSVSVVAAPASGLLGEEARLGVYNTDDDEGAADDSVVNLLDPTASKTASSDDLRRGHKRVREDASTEINSIFEAVSPSKLSKAKAQKSATEAQEAAPAEKEASPEPKDAARKARQRAADQKAAGQIEALKESIEKAAAELAEAKSRREAFTMFSSEVSVPTDTRRKPTIVFLDSLGIHPHHKIKRVFRTYLKGALRALLPTEPTHEALQKTMNTIGEQLPKVPFQENSFDCGLYVIRYAKCFLTSWASGKVRLRDLEDTLRHFEEETAHASRAASADRNELGDRLLRLEAEYKAHLESMQSTKPPNDADAGEADGSDEDVVLMER